MRLKTRFLACMLLVICLSVVGQATLAYFTAEETARNVVTTGGIEIVLQETVDEAGTPWTDVENVMPGDVIPKIVTVTNQQEPAWVRVKYTVAVTDAAGKSLALDPGDLTIETGDNWTGKADGWWYYGEALPTGATTQPLFEEVEFSTALGNAYQNCTVEITVQAEAVQTANNPDALGWPET